MLEASTVVLNAPVVVGVPLNGPWLIGTGSLRTGATAVAETLPAGAAGAARAERKQDSRIARFTEKGFILALDWVYYGQFAVDWQTAKAASIF